MPLRSGGPSRAAVARRRGDAPAATPAAGRPALLRPVGPTLRTGASGRPGNLLPVRPSPAHLSGQEPACPTHPQTANGPALVLRPEAARVSDLGAGPREL